MSTPVWEKQTHHFYSDLLSSIFILWTHTATLLCTSDRESDQTELFLACIQLSFSACS